MSGRARRRSRSRARTKKAKEKTPLEGPSTSQEATPSVRFAPRPSIPPDSGKQCELYTNFFRYDTAW